MTRNAVALINNHTEPHERAGTYSRKYARTEPSVHKPNHPYEPAPMRLQSLQRLHPLPLFFRNKPTVHFLVVSLTQTCDEELRN